MLAAFGFRNWLCPGRALSTGAWLVGEKPFASIGFPNYFGRKSVAHDRFQIR